MDDIAEYDRDVRLSTELFFVIPLPSYAQT